MNTTFLTTRLVRASATCATISALPQHAFHRLAVGQFHQQPLGTILARMTGPKPRQAGQFRFQLRQAGVQGRRQEVLGVAAAAVLRQGLRPQPQHPLLVHRAGTQGTQPLTEGFDSHRASLTPAEPSSWGQSCRSVPQEDSNQLRTELKVCPAKFQ
jgi:hypothetical protein